MISYLVWKSDRRKLPSLLHAMHHNTFANLGRRRTEERGGGVGYVPKTESKADLLFGVLYARWYCVYQSASSSTMM
jgi:hypothetical protein